MTTSTAVSLLVAAGILIASVGFFVWVSRRVRRGGKGAKVGMLGAIHEMLQDDRRRASETIIHRNAGDKEEEDASSEPPEPN